MTQQTHRLLIGSLGWQHEAWQGDYYPEDLPCEWRLGYYSNEFPLSVITDRERAGQSALIEELEACREDMYILLAVAVGAQPAADRELAPAVALLQNLPREGGLLLQVPTELIDDPAAWLSEVRTAVGPWPICVEPDGALSEAWRRALQDASVGWAWNSHTDRDGLAIGPLAVIRVDGAPSAKALRDCVEAGLAVNAPQRHVALIVAGQPPSIEILRQARTLEELM